MALKIRSIAKDVERKPRAFYRCQTKFTPEGEVFPDGRFSPDQLKALKAEKNLVVETVAAPDPDKKK